MLPKKFPSLILPSLVLPSLLLTTGCAAFQGPPSIESSLGLASMYLFRGVPQVDRPVLQGDAEVSLPAGKNGIFTGSAWGNLVLSDETGDAITPDGHAREFSEMDVTVDYTRDFGTQSLSVGFASFNFPNIPIWKSTSELYAGLSWPVAFNPSIVANWDVDEIGGVYLTGAASQPYSLDERFSVELGLSLSWLDSDQAEGYIGLDQSGLGELLASGELSYALDAHTDYFLGLYFSTLVDGDYRDFIDASGMDSDNAWVMLGVRWGL